MRDVSSFAEVLAHMPTDGLLVGLALAAFALAGFTIHVVHSIAKERLRK
ncbi:hypothetical protein [Phenylobacterium montanum]|uniref:DUF3149 domain-containing protein n=1 Tax=Phenylobacterium montanum TaxID=2823693 RepID=A0A975FWJ0_9CAUL|nr:hypothetical protein [Caulobacter sp. S6]QUD86242.1 hypothetical protein KCG34_14160 [Caulobacter sp. S6]